MQGDRAGFYPEMQLLERKSAAVVSRCISVLFAVSVVRNRMEEEGDALPKAKGQLLTQRVGRASERSMRSRAKRSVVTSTFALHTTDVNHVALASKRNPNFRRLGIGSHR